MKQKYSKQPKSGNSLGAQKARARALLDKGHFQESLELFLRLRDTHPADAELWFMSGALSGHTGNMEEAIVCCHQATRLRPDYIDAHYNLGQAYLHQGRFHEAIAAYRTVLKHSPDHMSAINNLGYALQQIGSYGEAVALHQRVLALQPQDAEALNNLGNALLGIGNADAAINHYRAALQINPDYVGAYINLGRTLAGQGHYQEAATAFEQAMRLSPDYLEGYISNGTMMLQQGEYEKAERSYRSALRLQPQSNKARSGLLFALNYYSTDFEANFREHLEWDKYHAEGIALPDGYGNSPDPLRRLRIGYVSPDLRTHSVAFFLEPLLANHDLTQVETFCYADVAQPDATTARLKSHCSIWRDIVGVPPAEVADQIHKDGIDILVDLAGHSGQHLMLIFAYKPAPVQATYLGYPNTTGLHRMDYRLTDAWADPPGTTEHWHTELLLRLPRGFLCYEPRPEAYMPPAQAPVHSKGHITFGSFNNLAKITPEVVAVWARILTAVPDARLILKTLPLRDASIRARYHSLFAREGVDPGRVDLLGWLPSPASHLELYGQIDIALDPFPYNGTTTTCEAIWMGVPVVVLAGHMHAGRVGVSLLSQLGLTDWIAQDEADYIARAAQFASNHELLARLRSELRERMRHSPLCEAAPFARSMETAYRTMWRNWCAGQQP